MLVALPLHVFFLKEMLTHNYVNSHYRNGLASTIHQKVNDIHHTVSLIQDTKHILDTY